MGYLVAVSDGAGGDQRPVHPLEHARKILFIKRGGSLFGAAFNQPDNMAGNDNYNQQAEKNVNLLPREQRGYESY